MLVSILIPTRNRVDYLRLSLASAQAQTGAEVEIVVSDDGSTDETAEFVRSIASADSRVRLLTDNPSPGIFQNVSHLIGQARGDAFTVLGDDDLLDHDFCRLLAEPLAAEATINLAFTDHRVIDRSGRELMAASRRSSERYGRDGLAAGLVADPVGLALRGGIWLGFTLYRRSAFEREPFDHACGTAADWDFALRAAKRGGIWFVPGRHASYRDHGETASRRGLRNAAGLAITVLERHSFQDVAAERQRRELLRDAAKRHAFAAAPHDRIGSRRARRLYLSLGGSRADLRFLLSGLLVRLPPPLAEALQSAVWAASGSVARVRQSLPL